MDGGGGDLSAVVEGDILVLVLAVPEETGTESEARTGFSDKFSSSLEELRWDFLEPVGDNDLFEWGQVLGDLAVDLVVLLPHLWLKSQKSRKRRLNDESESWK